MSLAGAIVLALCIAAVVLVAVDLSRQRPVPLIAWAVLFVAVAQIVAEVWSRA